jgi:hypothetical protein
MKLLVLQNYDVGFASVAELCCPSVAAYAARHGYAYLCFRGKYSGLSTAWDKLFLAERMLDAHDFVWTVDSDILILNPELKIADLIDPDFDVNICGDGCDDHPWSVNTGSVVWKSTRWTRWFLQRVAHEGHSSPPHLWEQPRIQALLHSPEVAAHFKRHHPCRFNHHGELLKHFCETRDVSKKIARIRDMLAKQGSAYKPMNNPG